MATTQDAELILHLYDLRREPVMRQAREWFATKFNPKSYQEFKDLCPPGTDNNRFFRMVTSYWEMACSFVTHGAVDEALFLDNCGECFMVWRKVSGWIGELRAERNNPGYLRHIEAVVRKAEARRG
jgi:hypothetical protein